MNNFLFNKERTNNNITYTYKKIKKLTNYISHSNLRDWDIGLIILFIHLFFGNIIILLIIKNVNTSYIITFIIMYTLYAFSIYIYGLNGCCLGKLEKKFFNDKDWFTLMGFINSGVFLPKQKGLWKPIMSKKVCNILAYTLQLLAFIFASSKIAFYLYYTRYANKNI